MLVWISVLFFLPFYFWKVSAAYFRKDFFTFLRNDGQWRLLGLTIEMLWLSAWYKTLLDAYVIWLVYVVSVKLNFQICCVMTFKCHPQRMELLWFQLYHQGYKFCRKNFVSSKGLPLYVAVWSVNRYTSVMGVNWRSKCKIKQFTV